MKAAFHLWPKWFYAIAIACLLGASPARALLSLPLAANQEGTITCLENPSFTYDLYLPPAYQATGTPLPILYTMYPNGGGMVANFKGTSLSMNIICVGITGVKNGVPWTKVLREMYAVTRDIRQRVNYDPTAEFVSGFSGGGECSYMFSRMRAQHVAGIFDMAGWLGRINSGASVSYYGIERVQTNLLVARTTGTSDTGTIFYHVFDSNYLATCGAVIKDWTFGGGHAVAPTTLMSSGLTWLVTQRIHPGPTDRTNAAALSTNWLTRITAGGQESVLRECVSNLMNFPRSWYAYQAQLTLDLLLTNYTVFRTLNVSNLAQGDFASDLFFYYAYGAATNGDWARYNSSMKALTGIMVTNDFDGTATIEGITVTVAFPTNNGYINITTSYGDHAGDVFFLLTNYNRYPKPQFQVTPDPPASQLNLWLWEDTPGLAYSVQSRPDLNSSWHDVPLTGLDTNTIWSASVDLPSDSVFYRVKAAPSPAASPPWPGQ